jgi:two-component system cell cycle sensor histidine kinase/response regulator CckA
MSRQRDSRERAFEAVRASEARYRAIVESAPDGVWLTDAEDRTSFVNRAMTEMLGLEAGDMLGRYPSEFVEGESRRTLGDALRRRRSGVTERYELTFKRADGTELVTEVSATPLYEPDGSYAGSTAIVIDTTERRRAQRAREVLEGRLQQAQRLETVGRLAGGIAHDFNNILAVILNYAHFVAERLPEDSPLRDDVDQISRAASRASELTRQLLIFSRRDPVAAETIDVNRLVEDTEKLLGRTLGHQVTLSSSRSPERCFVRADPAQLEHALLNLVVNARDAMPDGGSVSIATAREGDSVVISVTDDGPGMEPEVAARAFEPFFTTKPKGAGTGLGLATVYGTVTAAGGDARIETAPGQGTTVVLRLPLTEEPAEERPRAPAAAPADHGGATVLLVEDEHAVRGLSSRILTGAGYRCLEASGGTEALALYEAHGSAIDLLLTDVVMPGMSGAELAARIGAGREGPPVLFMSGYPGDTSLHPLLEKPFDAGQLLTAVREALAARERE